jgi:hypothetical protein
MNMLRFTAEASLYKMSGHYHTGRHAINLPTQMISTIYPAEVIEVYGCNPGFVPLGEGENMVCIPDPTLGGDGGPGDGGGPYDDGEPGGSRGGGTRGPGPGQHDRPPRQPRPRRKYPKDGNCSGAQLRTPEGVACNKQTDDDLLKNRSIIHLALCEDGKVKCCRVVDKTGDILSCTYVGYPRPPKEI